MRNKWITVALLIIVIAAVCLSVFVVFQVFDEIEKALSSSESPDSPGNTEQSGITDNPGNTGASGEENPSEEPDTPEAPDTPEVPADSVIDTDGQYSLTVSPSSISLELGESEKLLVYITHSNTQLPLSIVSSNSAVATVKQEVKGWIVNAVGIGEAEITVEYDTMCVRSAVTVLPRSSSTAEDDIVDYNELDFYLKPSEFAFQTYGYDNEVGESGSIKFLAHVSEIFLERVTDMGGSFKMIVMPVDLFEKINVSSTSAVDWKKEIEEQYRENEEFVVREARFEESIVRCFLTGINVLNVNRVMVAIPYVEFEERDYRQYAFVSLGENYLTYASSYAYVCSKAVLKNKTGERSYSEAALKECDEALMFSANLTYGIISIENNKGESRETLLEKVRDDLFYHFAVYDISTGKLLPERNNGNVNVCYGDSVSIAVRFFVISTLDDELYNNPAGPYDVLLYYEGKIDYSTASFEFDDWTMIAPSDSTGIARLKVSYYSADKSYVFNCIGN